jgi:hypothetical protein
MSQRHVHVERDANRAEFWLDPVRLTESATRAAGTDAVQRNKALVRELCGRRLDGFPRLPRGAS